ncbi:MAG TPA: hypothetical protein VHR64_07455, partial [Thermomicrobiales bacterium]|nr:hypothetical protein [Thermomicrobiales bacterium]
DTIAATIRPHYIDAAGPRDVTTAHRMRSYVNAPSNCDIKQNGREVNLTAVSVVIIATTTNLSSIAMT